MSWLTQRRWLITTITASVVASVVFIALSVRWFVRPANINQPGRADAVVMFGGAGARFERAVELVESEHLAPTLVLSDPGSSVSGLSPFGWYCDGHLAPAAPADGEQAERYGETLCLDPQPATTFGEAKALGRLAKEHGWQRVVIVVSTEQTTRARAMVRRCFDGQIEVATVPTTQNRIVRIVYEWAATGYYAVAHRSC